MNIKDMQRVFHEIRDTFNQYEGVLGVGVGEAEKDGKLTGEPAIVVLVEKKLPRNRVRRAELLPDNYRGVRIDVREPRLTQAEHDAFVERNGLSAVEAEENIDLFWLDDGKLHRMFQRRRREERGTDDSEPQEPGDAPVTELRGEIFVIEDKDCNSVVNSDGSVDHVAAYQLFRAEFGDHYDFVFFRYDASSGVTQSGNSSPTIYNQISGIGHYQGDSYDGRASYGTSKLQSLQKMSWLGQVRTCLHETGHRWLAYAYHREGGIFSDKLHQAWPYSVSQQGYHWGTWFDNDNSCMDYDYDDWVNSTTAGEFEKVGLVTGPPGTDEFSYHPLDLYLMGLIDPTEVGGFRYIDNPTDPDGDGSYAGTQVNLTVNNVIDEEGARSPAYPNTQRVFHQVYILITKDISGIGSLTDATTILGELELYRTGMIAAFRRSTRSRAMIDGSLLHSNYNSLYSRDNAVDAGGTSSTGAFWDSPDIWIRNSNDSGTSHQDTLRGQDNFVHVRVWNNSGTDYEDTTVRVYRANFAGTEFFYPDDWHPDDLIGEETLTVPAGGNATAVIRWDAAFIPDATWHPCLLAEVIPMEVTPEQRHHVWDNRKLSQKNISIVDAPSEVRPLVFDFRFGHPSRKLGEFALLTVSRTAELDGLELFLDADGLELEIESDPMRLPAANYLKPGPGGAKPSAGVEGYLRDAAYSLGGLSLTFPRDTEVILGGSTCGSTETGCLGLTICRGSRFRLHGLPTRETSPGKLVPLYRQGRLLYRLPVQGVVGLKVPIAGRGSVPMKLYAESTGGGSDGRGGFVRLIQSDVQSQIVGGTDILLRP